MIAHLHFVPPYAEVAQIVASLVFHVLWQAPLMAFAAACAIRIGKPKVRVAHTLWSAALALCVLAPALSTFAAHDAAAVAQHESQVLLSYDSASLAGLPPMMRLPMWQRLLRAHLSARDGMQPFFVTPSTRLTSYVAAAYGVAVVMFALRLVVGWRRTRRLVHESSSADVPMFVRTALEKQSLALGVQRPKVLLSSRTAGPVLAGVLRPAILLPLETASALTQMEIAAVLAHELAHLRRRDPLAHALCRVLLMPVYFHPAAVWIAARVRQTREMACDADAAVQMGSATRYARALLQVAERTGRGAGQAVGLDLLRSGLGLLETGLQLFGTGAMEERMQMLVKREERETRLRRAARCAAVFGTVTVAIFLAGMLQVRPALAGERAQASIAMQTAPGNAVPSLPLEQQQPAVSPAKDASTAQQTTRIRTGSEGAGHSLASDALQTNADARTTADALREKQALMLKREIERLSSPEFQEEIRRASQIDIAKLQAEIKKQMEYINSPEFQEQIRSASHLPTAKLQEDMRRQMDRMNSPEFKAQMDLAKSFDPAKLQQMMRDAQEKQAAAMKQMRENMLHQQPMSHLSASTHPPLPTPEIAGEEGRWTAEQPAKLSAGVLASLNTHKEQPKYPEEAKKKGVQGAVLLHVLVGETGHVEDISVLQSPDPMLSESALAAVRQWIYTPYVLNGKATAVESTVTVTYSLESR